MNEIKNFLENNFSGALATVDSGKPRVRPWGFMFEDDGKFYFCTANTKEVYKQLMKNAFVEFTSTSKEMVTVRLAGEAVFTKDPGIKQRVLEKQPMVKNIYQSADNPIFEVFYIEHGEAIVSDFSGQPPRKISF